MSCPVDLKRLYREGRVLPFIGAGASMGIHWEQDGKQRRGPSWTELVNQAARILGADEPDLLRVRGTDLQILEYFYAKNGNFAPLINWLSINMNPPDESLEASPLHRALSQLELCKIFYTTNYDDFLERALKIHNREVTVIASERHMGRVSDQTQVVKFHGDLNTPESMVLSESQYERRTRLETQLDLKLCSDVLGRALLFIGYSFRDPNVAYLFRLVTDRFKDLPASFSGRRAYIIVANPSDFEMQLFNQRRIEVIPAVGEDRTNTYTEIIEDLAS